MALNFGQGHNNDQLLSFVIEQASGSMLVTAKKKMVKQTDHIIYQYESEYWHNY